MNAYVLAIGTGDGVAYPPDGIRVTVHDTMPNLVCDLAEFAEARDLPTEKLAAAGRARSTVDLWLAIKEILPDNETCIYSGRRGPVLSGDPWPGEMLPDDEPSPNWTQHVRAAIELLEKQNEASYRTGELLKSVLGSTPAVDAVRGVTSWVSTAVSRLKMAVEAYEADLAAVKREAMALAKRTLASALENIDKERTGG